MNIIYFDLWTINGALVDAIEYYLYLKSIKVDVKLVIFQKSSSIKIDSVYELIEDRYNLDFNYKDGIVLEKKMSIALQHKGHTMMVVDWGTFLRLPLFPSNWKNIILWFDYNEEIMEKYRRIDRFDNVFIYKEMHYEYGISYKFKFAFDLFKKIKKVSRDENIGYINCISKGTISDVLDFSKENKFDEIIVTSPLAIFDKMEGIIAYKKHPPNFFSLFSTYIYIHDGQYKDPRPRLFHESAYYDKKIIYINEDEIKDGGYYRYHDAMTSDIQTRNLTTDDAIIQKFLI